MINDILKDPNHLYQYIQRVACMAKVPVLNLDVGLPQEWASSNFLYDFSIKSLVIFTIKQQINMPLVFYINLTQTHKYKSVNSLTDL